MIDLRLSGEIEVDVFKRRKVELLQEQKRMEELSQDAGHRVKTWFNTAEKALDLAEAAKKKFETGDLETKRDILQGLGVRFIFTNRTLQIELKPLMELILEIAPKAQVQYESLEPAHVPIAQGSYGRPDAQNEEWGENDGDYGAFHSCRLVSALISGRPLDSRCLCLLQSDIKSDCSKQSLINCEAHFDPRPIKK